MKNSSTKLSFVSLTEKANDDLISSDEEDYLAGYRKVGANKKVRIHFINHFFC
jgi:hypothetical protein